MILFLVGQLNAQPDESINIEHGLLFSPRIDSDDDFSFNVKGFGIE